VNNAELRSKLGEAGKKFVMEKFSRRKEVDEIKNVYLSLLQRKNQLS
jgi:glycosyltransferase involved in cell wall biosynthesis